MRNSMRPVAVHGSASSQQLTDCGRLTQKNFDSFAETQLDWYRARDHLLPPPEIRSVIHHGDRDRAVVIVHGYNSSPQYHRDLTAALNSAGFTVLVPLLAGYGSDAKAANDSTVEDWTASIESAVSVVQACHSQISLIGHSVGGALAAYEVLYGGLPHIDRVVNLAPFLKSPDAFLDHLVNFATLSYDTIDLETFRSFTGGLDPYLILPLFMPLPRPQQGRSEHFFPLRALRRAFALLNFFRDPPARPSTVPTLLVLTEADRMIDNRHAMLYTNVAFTDREIYTFSKDLGIGHSFQQRENNPRFDEFVQKLIDFLDAP